jgi:hypothetical protein
MMFPVNRDTVLALGSGLIIQRRSRDRVRPIWGHPSSRIAIAHSDFRLRRHRSISNSIVRGAIAQLFSLTTWVMRNCFI